MYLNTRSECYLSVSKTVWQLYLSISNLQSYCSWFAPTDTDRIAVQQLEGNRLLFSLLWNHGGCTAWGQSRSPVKDLEASLCHSVCGKCSPTQGQGAGCSSGHAVPGLGSTIPLSAPRSSPCPGKQFGSIHQDSKMPLSTFEFSLLS